MSETAIISLEELVAALNQQEQPTPVLVEALPESYFRHTHLPGAVCIPPGKTGELAPLLLPDPSAFIVVYCAGPT